MLENESLELQPEGEPIRHIQRMESLGSYDGRSGEYVIGSVGECTAQTDCCARDCMSVVDLRAVAVDGADIKSEIEFRLLLRELRRKLISKIPAVCSHQRDLAIEAAHGVAPAHADHIHAIEPLLVHRPLSV